MLSTFKSGEERSRVGRSAANKALCIGGPTRVEFLSEFTVNQVLLSCWYERSYSCHVSRDYPDSSPRVLKEPFFFFKPGRWIRSRLCCVIIEALSPHWDDNAPPKQYGGGNVWIPFSFFLFFCAPSCFTMSLKNWGASLFYCISNHY